MPTPDQKAVEAEWPELWVTRSAFADGSPKWYLSGNYNPTSQDVLPQQLYGPIAHIRSQLLGELRKAAEELESDPAADCGTYIHDVEAAILRLLRNRP